MKLGIIRILSLRGCTKLRVCYQKLPVCFDDVPFKIVMFNSYISSPEAIGDCKTLCINHLDLFSTRCFSKDHPVVWFWTSGEIQCGTNFQRTLRYCGIAPKQTEYVWICRINTHLHTNTHTHTHFIYTHTHLCICIYTLKFILPKCFGRLCRY